jgi:hypothetical protein
MSNIHLLSRYVHLEAPCLGIEDPVVFPFSARRCDTMAKLLRTSSQKAFRRRKPLQSPSFSSEHPIDHDAFFTF